jgi:hypothetical protein
MTGQRKRYSNEQEFLELLSSILFSVKNCLDFGDHHTRQDSASKQEPGK